MLHQVTAIALSHLQLTISNKMNNVIHQIIDFLPKTLLWIQESLATAINLHRGSQTQQRAGRFIIALMFGCLIFGLLSGGIRWYWGSLLGTAVVGLLFYAAWVRPSQS